MPVASVKSGMGRIAQDEARGSLSLQTVQPQRSLSEATAGGPNKQPKVFPEPRPSKNDQLFGTCASVFYICKAKKCRRIKGKMMSILTGAELGGGLPPPGLGSVTSQNNRDTKTPESGIPFSSEAAILLLTATAARTAVQRGQELVDRRSEKNAAEKEEARKAAADEALQRSLERQGLKEPEPSEVQGLVNSGRSEEGSEGDEVGTENPATDSSFEPPGAATIGVQGNDAAESNAAADQAVRLNVLA